ncbi:DUF935 family protein [Acinetobacter sichuanensis]|uniref:phage portal protein family protein n=1 Tax=Acinetobacter sichuanensis TaxID=2136183 RepID=UPI00280C4E84|nr:DUF935 family protein [Acinetobacter sichuanensis]MDQ9021682.1 DUF935 family protein [Acinetobacter sichuanensis]
MAKKQKTVISNNPEAGGLYSHEAESALISYLMSNKAPDIDDVLRKAGVPRHKLRVLLSDDDIYQCVEKRQDKLEAAPFRIEPADTTESIIIAEQIRKWWSKIVIGTQNARWFGYSVFEAVYSKVPMYHTDTNTTYLGWEWLGEKPMQWFEPKNDGRLLYRQDGMAQPIEVDQRLKFFLTQCKASYEQPYGEALLSRLYWVWFFKTHAFKFWAKFVERFGNPLLKGKSIDNKKMKQALLDAHASAVIAIDRQDEVEMVSASGSQGGSAAFEVFDKVLEKRIQKVILGGTLTSGTDGGGSRALGDVHLEVEKNKLGADIRMIVPTIQNIINALCEINGWKSHRIILGEEKSLDEKRADRDVKLKNAGANLTPQYFQREYGLQDGDIAKPEQVPQTQFNALPKRVFSFKASSQKVTPEQQELEQVANDQPKALMTEEQLQKIVQDAKSHEDLMTKLYSATKGVSTDEFEIVMSKALFMADVMGYVHAQQRK